MDTNPFTIINDKLTSIEAMLVSLQAKLTTLEEKGSESKKLLNINEACAFLGMKKSTIYAKGLKGEIASSNPGGRGLFYSEHDLIEYQKRNRKKTNAEIHAEARKGLARK